MAVKHGIKGGLLTEARYVRHTWKMVSEFQS